MPEGLSCQNGSAYTSELAFAMMAEGRAGAESLAEPLGGAVAQSRRTVSLFSVAAPGCGHLGIRSPTPRARGTARVRRDGQPTRPPSSVIETSDISINSPGASPVAAHGRHPVGDHIEEAQCRQATWEGVRSHVLDLHPYQHKDAFSADRYQPPQSHINPFCRFVGYQENDAFAPRRSNLVAGIRTSVP